ncbi:MAG TPA: IPT/TIG domain-containing protein [Solirubrobacteraceae bacterium]|nr:IPT/TIG domain-containing protein [Solirubrobacteraceae bacterium]
MLLAGVVGALAVAVGLLGAMGAFASGGAPGAVSEHNIEITKHEAVLQATVFPHGAATECQFEYGTTEGAPDHVVACPFSPGSRPIGVPETANLKGLTEGTTYYWRIHAKNGNGEATSAEKSFTTLPHAPHSNTEPANEVKRTSATLKGIAVSDGSEITECYFEWGEKESSLPEHTPCAQSEFFGSDEPSPEVVVSAHISGLMESQFYYYRLVTKNAFGEDVGGRAHLQALPAAPKANTEKARLVERTTATLWGFVTPNDSKVTSCYFLYGLEGEGLTKTANCESFGAGNGEEPEEVTAKLTGLQEGSAYNYRLVAVNAEGTNEGGGYTLETEPSGPKVLMHHARNVGATSAELSASVNPHGTETECYFEYGTTPALGQIAPCESSPGDGEEYVRVGATVTGLSENTTYLVRFVAFNEKGSGRAGEGENKNFTTGPGGEPPVVEKLKKPKGSSAGGETVKIIGKHFEEVSAVYFGFTEATIKAVRTTEIEVISPPGVGKVDVTVWTTNGTSATGPKDLYSYGKPIITSISPDEAPVAGGTEVTVKGSGFEVGQHGTEFKFGKAVATSVECTTSTTCVVIAPPAGIKKKQPELHPTVAAYVNKGKSNKEPFTYTE